MSESTQWQVAGNAAQRYEQIIVPSFLAPFARALIERAALQPGESVLDAGCGTGAAARLAAAMVGASGHVVGVDVNASMIEVAKSLPVETNTPLEWREESIYQMLLADSSMDVVVCSQVLQFLPDKPRALSEMKRVLNSNGRVAFSVWANYSDVPYFLAMIDTLTSHLGTDAMVWMAAGSALGDAATIRDLLEAAGFRNVELLDENINVDLPRMEEFVPRHISATPVAAAFGAATPEVREAVVRQIADQMAPYTDNAGCHVPFKSYVALGWK